MSIVDTHALLNNVKNISTSFLFPLYPVSTKTGVFKEEEYAVEVEDLWILEELSKIGGKKDLNKVMLERNRSERWLIICSSFLKYAR